MIGVRDAMDRIVAGVSLLGAEEVALTEALGDVLAEDVDSPITLPARTNSAMDGFAVRSGRRAGRDQDRRRGGSGCSRRCRRAACPRRRSARARRRA